VHRAIQRLGYSIHRLANKRVLDAKTKRKRVAWARARSARRAVWWQNRGYADAHYWYLPRTRAEAAGTTNARAIYRKHGEGQDPKFHGGKGASYKQGRRVGIWGLLTREKLSVAFLPAGRICGSSHATVVRRYYWQWASECQCVFHDGEKALHSPPAKEAYAEVGVKCATLPPNSPDLNPIENVWAILDSRLGATAPRGWEREKAFRRRVRNAVAWVNANRRATLRRTVASMPRRLQSCIEVKGALTPY